MYKKILIAEDLDSISLGITTLLDQHFRVKIESSKYCDDAYQKIKKAIQDKAPFDLLITDLSFKQDERDTVLTSGETLIMQLRNENIAIPIIVYSVDDNPYLIRDLFNKGSINAFVVKGRDGNTELLEALQSLSEGGIYISPQFSNVLKEKPVLELDKYDIEILKLLSEGNTQEDISVVFKRKGYPSPSTSSIEKKINKLKFMLKVQNSIHLIAVAKDMRLI